MAKRGRPKKDATAADPTAVTPTEVESADTVTTKHIRRSSDTAAARKIEGDVKFPGESGGPKQGARRVSRNK
jgi:hypothetical protein